MKFRPDAEGRNMLNLLGTWISEQFVEAQQTILRQPRVQLIGIHLGVGGVGWGWGGWLKGRKWELASAMSGTIYRTDILYGGVFGIIR